MAGRLVPILVAGISGIAIGVATFGGELKEQQKRRLDEEYRRDLAAAAARGEDVSALLKEAAAKAQENQPAPAANEDTKSSRLASALGLWAWKKQSPEPTIIREAQQAKDSSKQQ